MIIFGIGEKKVANKVFFYVIIIMNIVKYFLITVIVLILCIFAIIKIYSMELSKSKSLNVIVILLLFLKSKNIAPEGSVAKVLLLKVQEQKNI